MYTDKRITGCAGSDEKKNVVVVDDTALPEAPIILNIENKWQDGKTLEEVSGVLKEVQALAMTIDGVLAFQYAMDVEKQENALIEVYRDGAALAAFSGKMADGLQAKLLGIITTTKLNLSGPRATIEPMLGQLAPFNPHAFYTDDVSPAFKPADAGVCKEAPIIISIENKWQEGKTKEEVAAVLKEVQAVAMSSGGTHGFQYAMDDETKQNCLVELYRDPAALQAFSAKMADGLQAKLLSIIETTSLNLSGPKAIVEPMLEQMAPFNPHGFFTDEVGGAVRYE